MDDVQNKLSFKCLSYRPVLPHLKGYKMGHDVRYMVCCAQGLKNEVEYFEPDE
jgi:hypothetical protein